MPEDTLRGVSIVGIGQIPVQKENSKSLQQMGADVVRLAMGNASVGGAASTVLTHIFGV